MCGRSRCTLQPNDIPRACHLNGNVSVRQIDIDRYRPSFNVAPGAYMPVIRREDGTDGTDFALHTMKWGLIPNFTKKDEKPDHFRMFNARSESIHEKASFRRLIPKSRCLVTVEGFYEWKKDGSKKQPFYIHFKDDRPLVFAALYDSWKNPEGEIMYTFTILTTSSSTHLRWLHDRMPVILGDAASTDLWLNGSASAKFDSLLKPYEAPELAWYPVTPAMGKISFDGPECIKELTPKAEEKPISMFFTKTGATSSENLKKPVKSAIQKPGEISMKQGPKVESATAVNTPPGAVESRVGETELPDHSAADADEKKQGIKRENEVFQTDNMKVSEFEAQNKLTPSPATKKSKSNNQATLHSFFRKS